MLNVNVTSLPLVVIDLRPLVHNWWKVAVAILPVSNVNLTSAGVSGLPSLQVTPVRIVARYTFFLIQLPFVASQGVYLSLSGS